MFDCCRADRVMERIVFPVPPICEYLTEETKMLVYTTTERDDQGSKVTDFFDKTDDMFMEMKWQKKLRCKSICSLWALSPAVDTWYFFIAAKLLAGRSYIVVFLVYLSPQDEFIMSLWCQRKGKLICEYALERKDLNEFVIWSEVEITGQYSLYWQYAY